MFKSGMIKTSRIFGLTFIFSLWFSLILCNASLPQLPVDIDLRANYLGGKYVELVATIKGIEPLQVKAEIALAKALTPITANNIYEGALSITRATELRTIVSFKEFNAEYPVRILVIADCEDCKGLYQKIKSMSLVTLETGPILLNSFEMNKKVYNDFEFRRLLGIQMIESRKFPGVKGLYHPRSGDNEFNRDRVIVSSLRSAIFLPNYEIEVPEVSMQKGAKKRKSKHIGPYLASTTDSIEGSVTFYHEGENGTFGIDSAFVFAAYTLIPGYTTHSVEGYTNSDGSFKFYIDIPDGYSRYDDGGGIEAYLMDSTGADLSVQHIDGTQKLYMAAKMFDGYHVNFNATDNIKYAARLYHEMRISYDQSSNNNLNSDGVYILFPGPSGPSYVHARHEIDMGDIIRNFYSLYTVGHEHGHHLMLQAYNGSWPSGGDGANPHFRCTVTSLPFSWAEGWADFYGNLIAEYGYGGNTDYEPNLHCNFPGLGNIARDSVEGLVSAAVRDLYDSDVDNAGGYTDNYSAGLSSIGTALQNSVQNSIYDFVDDLKDDDPNNSTAIENSIRLNLPGSPGGLLLASSTSIISSSPKELVFSSINYPNPFNPSTTIQFSIPERSENVLLQVFNIRGQHIKILINGKREQGSYTVFGDGTDNIGRRVASGIYLYRLKVNSYSLTKKMVVLK